MNKQLNLIINSLQLLLLFMLVHMNQSSPISLSDNKENNNKQQFNIAHTNAMRYRNERRHESYDTNNDVLHAHNKNNSIAMLTLQQQDQLATNSNNNNSRYKRELADWFIAPNTRWCGRGNTANGTYNHLGGASAADKCCRRHDHCQLYIPAMSKRYELFNYLPYTLSHCNCDMRFRTCLKMANDEDADTIGKLFFNMMPSHCFRLRREKLCLKRAADGTCESHQIKQKAHLLNNKKF